MRIFNYAENESKYLGYTMDGVRIYLRAFTQQKVKLVTQLCF
jgi:hypothetical protein